MKKISIDLVCVALLIGVALAIALPRYRLGIEFRDEGVLAYSAVRVLDGQIPNRDFFTLQPPLSFYVAAGFFKLFGTSLLSLRILGLTLYVLIPLFVYGVARQMLSAGFSLAAALLALFFGLPFFGFVPWAVWQGITLTLTAIFFYLRAINSARNWTASIAGIFTALSLCARHEQATYAILSIFVLTIAFSFAKDTRVLPKQPWRTCAWWFFTMLAVCVAFVILWWREGALPEMFRQLVVFALTTYARTSSLPFPQFNSEATWAENAVPILYFVPPTAITAVAVYILRRAQQHRFSTREALLTFLVVWSALFYLQVVVRSDFHHLLFTLPPVFILSAAGISILFAAARTRVTKILSVGIPAALTACYLAVIQPIVLPDLSLCNQFLELKRARVQVDNAPLITGLVNDVQRFVPPNRSILSLPYFSMLYFLSERRNPTRWNYLWPGDQTPADFEKLISEAQNDPPAAVFINGEDEMATYAPIVLDYVHREYRRVGNVGNVTVYLPKLATP